MTPRTPWPDLDDALARDRMAKLAGEPGIVLHDIDRFGEFARPSGWTGRRSNTAAQKRPRNRATASAPKLPATRKRHDPLTTAESIKALRRPHLPTRLELRQTVPNKRQPAQKSGANRDNISSAPMPCSIFAPVSVHTGCENDHYKIDVDRNRLSLNCANMTGTAPNARVELRGFEPLTP
jgi:hypothetical protein